MWLAPGHLTAGRAAALLAGTALVVGAANALNCYLERESDALMRRTRDRPLPAGRVEPWVALALGVRVASTSIPPLGWATPALTALLVPLKIAGPFYGAAASVLGLGLCAHAASGLRRRGPSQRWARSFFLVTLAYLSLLFIALFLGAR